MTRTLGPSEPQRIRSPAARPRPAVGHGAHAPGRSPSPSSWPSRSTSSGSTSSTARWTRATCSRSPWRRAPRAAPRSCACRAPTAPACRRSWTLGWTAWSRRCVDSAAQARRLVERLRHPPHGTRGFAARRAAGYGRPDAARRPTRSAWCRSRARPGSRRPSRSPRSTVSTPSSSAAPTSRSRSTAAWSLPRRACARRSRTCRRAAAEAGIASGIAGPDDAALLSELAGRQLDAAGVLGGRPALRARGRRRPSRACAARRGRGCVSAPEAWHVTRTLRAMELLAVAPRSAPELADGLGVHVRTARRVLKRLESEGYVMLSDDRRRRYRPDDAHRRARGPGRGASGADPDGRPARARAARGARTRLPPVRAQLPVGALPGPRRRRGRLRLPPPPARAGAVPLHGRGQGAARLARELARGGARRAARGLHRPHDDRPRVAAPRARADRRARVRGGGPRVRAGHPRARRARARTPPARRSPPSPWSPRQPTSPPTATARSAPR